VGPKVTFVVPCYNLAHLLPECINSILTQTYEDFEVLIMDDCSPDATPEVAQSFIDPRVKHIRNERNLKHLANYNKGINMARGTYVWLISADDCLRKPYVLEQYVTLMDDHPEVGFVFCSAMGLQDGQETELLDYSNHGAQNTIFDGKQFLMKLLERNGVVSASAMARKDCYEKISLFPLDMPYAGDWYLWSLFSIYYDVAYFSEPMVSYRQHNQSMTNFFVNKDIKLLFQDDVAVLKRIRDMALQIGLESVIMKCNDCLVLRYVFHVVSNVKSPAENGFCAFEDLLHDYTLNQQEQKKITARIYAGIADHYYGIGEPVKASCCYVHALHHNWLKPVIWIKLVLNSIGKTGSYVRSLMSATRRIVERS